MLPEPGFGSKRWQALTEALCVGVPAALNVFMCRAAFDGLVWHAASSKMSGMNGPSKQQELRQRLRIRSREIVWALLLTLLALGAIAVSILS